MALITSTDASGQDAYKNIKSLIGSEGHKDVELVAEAQFNPTDVSASAQIQRLKGANPGILIAWLTGGPIGTVFKAIRDAGIDIPVTTTDGNMTYAQMTQYEAFLPKELYIPSPDWLKTSRPNQAADAVAAKRELRRRSAIELVIDHMKADGHLGRCYLKGTAGDAANAILTAVGHNLRLMLAWLRILLCLILTALWHALAAHHELKSAC